MLNLPRPYVDFFFSFEIIDIFLKMKIFSIRNFSSGQFELFSKFELFFVYKNCYSKCIYKKSKDFKFCD